MMSREEVPKLLGQEREPDRAQQSFESHLARAKWMAGTNRPANDSNLEVGDWIMPHRRYDLIEFA